MQYVLPARNPITIVNLYNYNRYEIGKRKKPRAFGKHHLKSIPGLATYDETAYKNCLLSNPKSFSIVTRRRNKNANNELIEIMDNNKELLLKYIREITCIYFSNKKFEYLLSEFINMEGYDYEFINKFNLPYAFLYQQRKINIFGQKFSFNNDHGIKLQNAIKNHSQYYEITNNNQISVKPNMPFVELSLALFNHRIVKDSNNQKKQTVDIILSEDVIKSGKSTEILKYTIDIDTISFSSEIK
ncbi:hypothetical protein [Clostridium saccharoperbutylacetonicum]|uniref:hypothetical protein n=1 Tax=Clostridium saccharoperbutylacetonicum TaxID=36745 RepID=UPI0009840911|nr:hypothetical protein [Clostridium saccharoperbutylacetonicum]AQR93103.1 hypothetical protein CLSAP_03780 [Clostridium saccharoperbutylacetonicum]NSB34513.1 hypothetical protein [Clostridium saccharoperbutylacetonicum]